MTTTSKGRASGGGGPKPGTVIPVLWSASSRVLAKPRPRLSQVNVVNSAVSAISPNLLRYRVRLAFVDWMGRVRLAAVSVRSAVHGLWWSLACALPERISELGGVPLPVGP